MHPHGLYGSSEVQALFSVAAGESRLLAGGVPVSSAARLAVRDPQTGAALPAGASGELWIDAPSRFIGYLEDAAATERAIDADGMFRTGDLARLGDADFVFEARIGDAMRLGGFLVSPEEIEAVIQAEPGVASVQVVAAANGGSDPVPVAFVLPAARRGAGRGGPAGALPPTVGAVQGPRAHRGGRGIPHRRQPERPEDSESPLARDGRGAAAGARTR